MFRRIRKAYETYRAVRWALWALGGLGTLIGTAGGALAISINRARGMLSMDSPEYAADTTVDPWGLARLKTLIPAIPIGRIPPAIPVILGLLLLAWLMTRIPEPKPDNPWDTDPRRFFSDADRTWIRSLTGDRCEHRSLFGLWRCRRKGEQMDHWYPHSKGGATERRNLDWMCTRHNSRKSDRTPTLLDTLILYLARLRYLPARWRGYAWCDGLSRDPMPAAAPIDEGTENDDPYYEEDYDYER